MPLGFQQKQTFKSKPEEIVEEFKLNGGLVTDVHETKLAPNQSPNLGDVIFDTTNNLLTRNGYLRHNGDPIGSASDEVNSGASTGTVALASTADYAAQTFTIATNTGIVQTSLWLAMASPATNQYIQVELWGASGAPTEYLISAQKRLISGTSETKYNFRFRVPYSSTTATTYAIVARPITVQTTQQAVSSVLVHRTGNAYASGAAYSSSDSGLNWSAIANVDLKFEVLTGGDTGSTGLIRFYGENSIKQMISKFNTTYSRFDDTTGVATTVAMGNGITPSTSYVDYTVSNGTLLVVDDSNYILKYRGSTNAVYTTGTITVVSGSQVVTGSGTTWNTATNAEVGEYIKLPDSKWYKITVITNNTSLTIEAPYYGTGLAGQTYIISPWGVVQGRFSNNGSDEAIATLVKPQPAFIENHINRIWTLDGNELRFSALDLSITGEHFNDWDTSNNAGQIIIPSGNGDSGTGLYSLGNTLYIFQRRAIWRLYGSSPANFELRNVTNEIGMLSQKTLVEWNDLLIFQSDFGIYLFDGSNLKNISEGVVNTYIATWASNLTPVATLWDNRYLLSFTEPGDTVNSAAIFYDLNAGTFWKINNFYASAFATWAGGNDDNRIYFAASNQGSVYRWDIGTHDDGYNIESLYDTPSLSFGSGMNNKSLKRFYVQQLAKGDWNMETFMFTNISEVDTTGTPINLSPGNAAIWDVAQWDVDEWSGEGALITTRLSEFQGQGRYFKYRFSQDGYGEGFEILGLTSTARQRRLE